MSSLRFLTAGESHGPALMAILEGLPAGLPLNSELIAPFLQRRQRGYGAGPRMKLEQDQVQILAGVMAGLTTGAPLAFLIPNQDHERWLGREIPAFVQPRPGHADLTGALKYGYTDLRPALERASARETAARVAVGAACTLFLEQFGVQIGGYVRSLGEVNTQLDHIPPMERVAYARQNDLACPDPAAVEPFQARIRQAIESRDTLGGVIEAYAFNLPPGLGSYVHWDRRLDARLAATVMSIQAIKGVEIGPAFENTRLPGTQAQDAIRLKDEALVRPSGRAGGLEGGISNGEPLLVRAAMKPIATTLTPQASDNLASGQEEQTTYERSDFCPVPRAVVIVETMIAFTLADAILEKVGGDSLGEIRPRWEALRKARLAGLSINGQAHIWWPE